MSGVIDSFRLRSVAFFSYNRTNELYTWKEGLERCCPFHAKGLYVERSPRKVLSFPRKRSIRGKEPSKGVALSTQKVYTWNGAVGRRCTSHEEALYEEKRPGKELSFHRNCLVRADNSPEGCVVSTQR